VTNYVQVALSEVWKELAASILRTIYESISRLCLYDLQNHFSL